MWEKVWKFPEHLWETVTTILCLDPRLGWRTSSLRGGCLYKARVPTQSESWGSLGFPGGGGASLILFFPREVVLHCQPQEACGRLVHLLAAG